MNYYERIQKAIDYIEGNLQNKIILTKVAEQAFMSLSSFYRLFFAFVGYSVKEYIRIRRISLAAKEIVNTDLRLIDIAVKYDFKSSDAFSRAFRRITGFLPSQFKENNKQFSFERINLMEQYFEVQDQELLNKYPNIKVLKKLDDMKVAYYCYYGENPEQNAFKIMGEWLVKAGIDPNKQRMRIFGYNNPSPDSPEQKEYGYEVCVTIDDNFVVKDNMVKIKTIKCGLYAVASLKFNIINDIGDEIVQAWHSAGMWLRESKYKYNNDHQWLEEHLGFNQDLSEIKGMDIYVPIKEIK